MKSDIEQQLDALALGAQDCRSCPLCETRHHIVFGEGTAEHRIMFVGEGPGRDEDLCGHPFVGKAGQLLTKILESAGIDRSRVYITNIVKCRPPGNRNPLPNEIECCERFLLTQIEAIDPKIIVAMGNVAKAFFLGPKVGGITKVRGRFFPWEVVAGIEIFPMFHPSYLLRNDARHHGSPKWQTWEDVKLLVQRCPPPEAKGSE